MNVTVEDLDLEIFLKTFPLEDNPSPKADNKESSQEPHPLNETIKHKSSIQNNRESATLEQSPEIKENLPNVPTPFKRALFWKTPPEEIKKLSKKPKEKIPAFVVSEV